MHELNISFQSLQLPPPFAYAYTLALLKSDNSWSINFALEYLQRDTITEEEIEEEGFTGDDDFSWSGELPEIWAETIGHLLDQTVLQKELADDSLNHLFLEDTNEGKSGYPLNQDAWEYHLEELIQAIYELANREHPLRLHFIRQKENLDIKLDGSFAQRKFSISGSEKAIPWEQLKMVLAQIENLAIEETPKYGPQKKGFWLSFDEESYFEVKSSSESREFIELLQSL